MFSATSCSNHTSDELICPQRVKNHRSHVPAAPFVTSPPPTVPLQVLVLLDVSPDQSMVDEGVAREVINRVQKLRKKVRRLFMGRRELWKRE